MISSLGYLDGTDLKVSGFGCEHNFPRHQISKPKAIALSENHFVCKIWRTKLIML